MTFQINGSSGKYDNMQIDDSAKYGKNAAENMFRYMESPIVNDTHPVPPVLDFMPTAEATDKNIEALDKYADKNDEYLNSLPPLEYEYRYMPEGNFDKKALLAAASEELGGVNELSVKEFEDKYLLDEDMTAESLDINKDGKIDVSEYATTVLAADVLSKDGEDINNVDGTINSKGENAVLEYAKKSNSEAAAKLYSSLYNTYGLGTVDDLK